MSVCLLVCLSVGLCVSVSVAGICMFFPVLVRIRLNNTIYLQPKSLWDRPNDLLSESCSSCFGSLAVLSWRDMHLVYGTISIFRLCLRFSLLVHYLSSGS